MWRSEITKQSEFQKTIRGSDFWLGSLKWEIVALSMFIVDHLGKGSSCPLKWATQLREQNNTKSGMIRGNKTSATWNSESFFLQGSEFWLGFLKWEIIALSMFTVNHLGKGSSYPPLITLRHRGAKHSDNMSRKIHCPENILVGVHVATKL